MKLDFLQDKRVVILGLGREGLSTYRFLRNRLPELPLTLADRSAAAAHGVEEAAQESEATTWALGERYLDCLEEAHIVFKAPGIPGSLPEIEAARCRGARITSNTELFFELCPGRTVGVTGTKGKSTTTSLVHTVLRAGGLEARLVGNIGYPPLSMLEGSSSSTTFVVELSSYQLADLSRSPNIAVLQNIVPEHLDYHGSFEAYVEAKANITRFQTEEDLVVFNAGGPLPSRIARNSRARKIAFGMEPVPESGCFLEDGRLVLRRHGITEKVMPADESPLIGRFNLQNVMPAIVVGAELGVPVGVVADAVRSFKPLEHRIEPLGSIGGVRFCNDSISTVPEATMAAMETFSGHPLVLIAGGHDRGVDYAGLAGALHSSAVRALILFPPTGDRIAAELQRQGPLVVPCFRVETMRDAVDRAFEAAQPGDVVLLSPASASYGRYADYRDRGAQFKAEVEKRRREESR